MAKRPQVGEPSWFWRRNTIFVSVSFCFYMIWTLVDAPDTRVNETIANGLVWLLAALILGYAGFATVQDVAAIVTTRTAKPYAEPPQEPTPAPDATTILVQPAKPDPEIPE